MPNGLVYVDFINITLVERAQHILAVENNTVNISSMFFFSIISYHCSVYKLDNGQWTMENDF